MKIDFQETTNDLLTRIKIHDQFGGRNIDEWMLDLLKLQKGSAILDVGCGAGKQCFSYLTSLDNDCTVTGADVSADLLAQAQEENKKYGSRVSFIPLDFNKPFALPDAQYDFASCCFAIYYAENMPLTIGEMHRVLKTGGRLFLTGPMPENKLFFYDVITEATGKPIPLMPGRSRFSSEILSTVKSLFSQVDLHIFENPLTFPNTQAFIEYTRASLSEDRKLWGSFFRSKGEFEEIMGKIQAVAEQRLARDGKLVMTKVVGGILATK
jgi:ubiquinone/menaquinone biosynthesis C-methylase UbiE